MELVELHVPDFAGVSWPNIIQIVLCRYCVQFSQVMFILILEPMKTLLLQNYYDFLNLSLANVPILCPMKTSVIFESETEMEHLLEIGLYLRIMKVCDFYYILNHNEIETVMLLQI